MGGGLVAAGLGVFAGRRERLIVGLMQRARGGGVVLLGCCAWWLDGVGGEGLTGGSRRLVWCPSVRKTLQGGVGKLRFEV